MGFGETETRTFGAGDCGCDWTGNRKEDIDNVVEAGQVEVVGLCGGSAGIRCSLAEAGS